ncbi:MAG: hypothetical protein L7S72_09925 [Flavobacteriales bacterium]|nr:hypothetical protein [Flavobacteriales bacterium]
MFITEEKLNNISEQLRGSGEDKMLAVNLLTTLISDEDMALRNDNLCQVLWILRFESKFMFGTDDDTPWNKSVHELLDALKFVNKNRHARARFNAITKMKYRDVLSWGSPKGKAIVLKFFARKLQDVYASIPKLKTKITFEYDGIEYV